MNVCLTLTHFGAIALCARFPSLAVLLRSTERFANAIAFIASGLLASTVSVQAQIVPDGTLPNNSVVTPNGSTLTITGGTLPGAGTSLFHSFDQFSVLRGQTADFDTTLTPNVQNIFSRVTGELSPILMAP
jgi:large exoprotein involved in heme utilization and adhesion